VRRGRGVHAKGKEEDQASDWELSMSGALLTGMTRFSSHICPATRQIRHVGLLPGPSCTQNRTLLAEVRAEPQGRLSEPPWRVRVLMGRCCGRAMRAATSVPRPPASPVSQCRGVAGWTARGLGLVLPNRTPASPPPQSRTGQTQHRSARRLSG